MGRYAADDDAVPSQGLVVIDGSEGASVQLAPCCRPIPGDAIVGYLGRGEGLMVHTAECGVGKRLFERDSERWMHVEWAEEPTAAVRDRGALLVSNGKGVLAQVAPAVSAAEADITHIDMGDERGQRDDRAAPAAQRARPPAPGRGAAHAEARAARVLRVAARQALSGRLGLERWRRVAHLQHLDRLRPARRHQLHLVALARLQQRARDRRDPAHLALQAVGLVDALDGDRALLAPARWHRCTVAPKNTWSLP